MKARMLNSSRRGSRFLTWATAIAVAMAILLGAVGCSGTEAAETNAPSTASTQSGDGAAAASTTTQAPAAEPSGQVVISAGTDPAILDPMKAGTPHPEMSIASHIFDYLVWTTPDMQFEPMLAESWTMVDDLTWEFKLRKDVTFSNGEKFDAESVKYTIERGLDPKVESTDRATGFISLDSVEIVDPYTVRIHTKQPVPGMVLRLSFLAMLPPKYYSETPLETLALNPVGSGPYVLKEWVKNDHVTLEARSGYWGAQPKIKDVIFRPIPETGTVVSELMSGGVDIAPNIAPEDEATLEGGGLTILQQPGARRMQIGFNFTKDMPTKDKRVRQAMNYAVDVDTIGNALMGGLAKKSFDLIWPALADPSIKPYPYDIEKARALLKEAGYENGFTIDMQYPPGRYVKNSEVAQAIANDLAKVNIKVNLKPTDVATLGPLIVSKTTDPMIFLGLSDLFDTTYDLTVLDRNYAMNPIDWQNDEYQAGIEELQRTVDPARQKELSYQLQAIAYEECPWIYLYWNPDIYAKSSKVQDFEIRADEQIIMRDASVTE